MNSEIPQSTSSSAVPRTPLQVPAVDRTLTLPASVDAGAEGAEANWDPWTLIGHGAKGMLDHWLSGR